MAPHIGGVQGDVEYMEKFGVQGLGVKGCSWGKLRGIDE